MTPRERIVRYILGQQTEGEREQIEQEYFADAAFLREVQAVCDELVDDYLHDRMPAREREQFAQRLLTIPFLQERVKTERALERWANTAPVAATPKTRWLDMHLWKHASGAWFWPRAFALLLVLGLCAGLWFLARKNNSSPSPQMAQERPSPSLSEQAASPVMPTATLRPVASAFPSKEATTAPSIEKKTAPVIATILLSTDVVRSASEVATLSMPRQEGIVRVQLEIPQHTGQTYRAILQTSEQQPLQTWNQLSPRRYETAWVITLLIPAKLLNEGEHQIRLRGTNLDAHTFRFRVQKN